MQKRSQLTAAHVRYLIALKRLNNADGIKGSDIANALNLTKPSVHSMMDTFLNLKYIAKERGGQVFLTEYGLQRAMFFEEKYQNIKKRMCFEEKIDCATERAICAFMAELSEEYLETQF